MKPWNGFIKNKFQFVYLDFLYSLDKMIEFNPADNWILEKKANLLENLKLFSEEIKWLNIRNLVII